VAPRAAKYGNNALTGHSEEFVLPGINELLDGNGVDCLMNSQTFNDDYLRLHQQEINELLGHTE